MTEERPRFPVGTRFRSHLSGTESEIVADHHPHPNVIATAQITDNRYYVVETDGHRTIVFHDLLEQYSDVIYRPGDEPPAADDTP